MKLLIQPGKESEWTIPFIEDPSKSLGNLIPDELEEHHPLATIALQAEWELENIELRNIGNIYEEHIGYEEPTSYSLNISIIPSLDFYVDQRFEGASRSAGREAVKNSRIIKQNEKPTLVQKIWQSLPPGYGVKVENNSRSRQTSYTLFFTSSESPTDIVSIDYRQEFVDIELRGDTKEEILKGVLAFTDQEKYKKAVLLHTEDPALERQVSFILELRHGWNNNVSTYKKQYGVSMKTAKREIQELIDKGILKRGQDGNPQYIVSLNRS